MTPAQSLERLRVLDALIATDGPSAKALTKERAKIEGELVQLCTHPWNPVDVDGRESV